MDFRYHHLTTTENLEDLDLDTKNMSAMLSSHTQPNAPRLARRKPIDVNVDENDNDNLGLDRSIDSPRVNKRYCSPKYRNISKYEDTKADLSKYHNQAYNQQKFLGPGVESFPTTFASDHPDSPATRYNDANRPPTLLPASAPSATSSQCRPSAGHGTLQTIPENSHIGGSPGEVINIKEIKMLRKPKSEKRVRFIDPQRFEDGIEFVSDSTGRELPIPCNPIDCPESRLALENGRLMHSIPPNSPSSSSEDLSPSATRSRSQQRGNTTSQNTPTSNRFYHQSGCLSKGLSVGPIKSTSHKFAGPLAFSSHALSQPRFARPAHPNLSGTANSLMRPASHIAEVEGDHRFYSSENSNIDESMANLHLSASALSHSGQLMPNDDFGNELYVLSQNSHSEGSVASDTPEPAIHGSATKKSKDILKKFLGGRSSRDSDSAIFPLMQRIEGNHVVRYANLDTKKEWAFVAISPDSRTVVGVYDRDHFTSYSMEFVGLRILASGDFDGEPLTIAVSNRHLAILTLSKLQIFDHSTARKVYESASDRTGKIENFTSIAFSKSGLELCVGLTNGTVQFHFIATQSNISELEGNFHRGDPKMDIILGNGDYPFTMSFSDDDMMFACGTQKRLLLVYEFLGPAGWELRNKFKFDDWEPGTHRRISGAIFCAETRFVFATTTSARSAAYMYCIDGSKTSNCSQSKSYRIRIIQKGISRSALSLDGSSIALIDGEGVVYRCRLSPGSGLTEKEECTKVPGALIPARACWISWSDQGDLTILDKKGHLRVYENASFRRTSR